MSEFSDRPFVAGSIIGLRSFRVDSLGRLTGHTHRTVFVPGENVGECLRREDNGGTWHSVMFPGGWSTTGGRITASMSPWDFTYYPAADPMRQITQDAPGVKDVTLKKPEKPKHKVGQKSCDCGYYAYFDGRNAYHDRTAPSVAALIEGYGTVTVGSSGFRAGKARLVALIIPEKSKHATLLERVRHNYDGVPVFAKRKDAIAAYPVAPPLDVTPETCDDFWTRPVSS